mmetsp:Transcript_18523/g.53407  ORF Transcript_18523/g.53407 Transcript_18523/m.53407 type:complete len:478 (-) Transcript_18523:735-2168(-)|eukprot:CAMPEP_0113525438 /NCGR_PEP_ID=MMETSP0015_2-20120614/161_1 /TAXON_ID=2838 /ORGANISM="Odontella" /LENGTH=477 /DNA_ID=CAMNT_0000423603 /DNA_START=259 /DNA_END=1692 /DNA_ORIENTATION=- /assembly_acc=CAM_ASM_000160
MRSIAIIVTVCLSLAAPICLATDENGNSAQKKKWAVSWNAPFLSNSGYGSEAIANARGLNQTLDVDRWSVAVGVHGDSVDEAYMSSLPQDIMTWMEEAALLQWEGVNMGSPSMRPDRTVIICHSEPGAWWLPRPMYETAPCPPRVLPGMAPWHAVIGRTMFETDRLPSGWEDRLNAVDEIWVPTEHHRRIFEDAGVRRVRVVGQGIDADLWDPEKIKPIPWERIDKEGRCHEEDYRFLSVFKWEKRKGYEILLRSFWGAFPPPKTGSCLIIVTSLYHDSPEEVLSDLEEQWVAATGRSPEEGRKGAGIILLSGIPAKALLRLYRTVDAFVLPSRGEGWGRPYMEAQAMGLPVIATNWSGPTEFVTDGNGFLLPIKGLVDAGLDAFPGHKWADPDEKELRRLLVHLRDNPDDGREKGKQARRDVVERWSHKAVALDMVQHLEEIIKAPHKEWPMLSVNEGSEHQKASEGVVHTMGSDL